MHSNNIHNKPYDFNILQKCNPELSTYVYINDYKNQTIDFSNPDAVTALNRALLHHHYNIKKWKLPTGYLCPPVPSRADYIHYLADIIKNTKGIKGLDIGVGANCIYPILGSQIHNWNMVGVDISENSVRVARQNSTEALTDIEIRHQKDPAYIFQNIIQEGEYFNFTMCNPPFYSSAKEAEKANFQKNRNLNLTTSTKRNFGGQSNELWCNGGETLFIKRMIKQSIVFKDQVGFFTTLVSKNDTIPKLRKQLNKLSASHSIVDMQHGNKKSRILVWNF